MTFARFTIAFGLFVASCFAAQSRTENSISITKLREQAQRGDVESAYQLGALYGMGKAISDNPVALDYNKAAYWMGKAADQNLPQAQFSLGTLYADGHGVKQDYVRAFHLFQASARQGFVGGQYRLGNAYYRGLGAKKDIVSAAVWLSLAAAQGEVNARRLMEEIRLKLTQAQRDEASRRLEAVGKEIHQRCSLEDPLICEE